MKENPLNQAATGIDETFTNRPAVHPSEPNVPSDKPVDSRQDPQSPPVSISHMETTGSTSPHTWLRDVIISILVSAFIIIFLYQPVRVEGTSMLPMLQDQDRLFINKMAYRVGDIQRGDVVVFLYPHDHTKSYIKRIIAVGGDDLRIDHGRVYVNGERLKESYVPPRFTDERSQPETTIPQNEYFVMGDHRSISSDSRDFGLVDRDLIYGKAAFVYWPFDEMGVIR